MQILVANLHSYFYRCFLNILWSYNFYGVYQVSEFGTEVKFITEMLNVDVNTAASRHKHTLSSSLDNERPVACRTADKTLLWIRRYYVKVTDLA